MRSPVLTRPLAVAPSLLAVVLTLLLVAAPAASAGRACESVAATPAQVSTAQLAGSTVCLLNAQRTRLGLRPLRLNAQLSAAAQRHASDMQRRDYFSHVSRDGSTFVERIRRAGYFKRASRWFVGENLAWGSGARRSTPRGIVAAWMDSAPHKRNILDSRFREIGIGVAQGTPRRNVFGLPAATYATSFGTRG
jgi:uncharacterized protein YkwD